MVSPQLQLQLWRARGMQSLSTPSWQAFRMECVWTKSYTLLMKEYGSDMRAQSGSRAQSVRGVT